MLLRIWMIIWKEFLQIRRDPRMLAVVIVIPCLMLLIYGYAINLDVDNLRLGILDEDRSRESRDLFGAFVNSGFFELTATPASRGEIDRLLETGDCRAVVIIPVGYARKLSEGRVGEVQVLVDGSDSTNANTSIGYVRQIARQRSLEVTMRFLQRSGIDARKTFLPIDHRVRYWYNPELKSPTFLIPGLIAVILMALSTLLTSMTVVRERERGTIEALISTPIRPIELMLGKLLPYVIIAFGDVLLVTLTSLLIFHVPLRGSVLLLMILSGIFLAAALGIGLLISTVAPSQQIAMGAALIGSQLPTVLLSGFIFPISSMPYQIQLLTDLVPAAHFVRILRGLFLKGSGLAVLWKPALFLLVLGLSLLLLSSLKFRKKL